MQASGASTVDSAGPALQINHLTKEFPGTRALSDVSISVSRGSVHALLGGNGSGKSTLVKILAGVYQGDSGTFVRLGRELAASESSPALARELGFRFVHQTPTVFPTMSVAENVALGHGFPVRAGRLQRAELHRRTTELLERYEIRARADSQLRTLGPADQTMVAIARALQSREDDPQLLLVLDEPTASLPEHEVEILLDAVRRLAARGSTIIYVSHRIDEVLSIGDEVTVLRDGRHVATRDRSGITEDSLIEDILGRPLSRVFQRASEPVEGAPALEVRDLRGGPLRGVSFQARPGEVVGIAGLLGSGRTELLRMLFGAYPFESGEVRLFGQPVTPRSTADAMHAGIAYVPEDRREDAAFSTQSVFWNLTIAQLKRYRRRGRLSRRRRHAHGRELLSRFGIKAASGQQVLAQLSGGNQQKVVLARWLSRNPKLLLLDEPTQGVDVGARADVYAAVREAVREGAIALLVTSDFEELAQASDRVLVLQHGSIVHELTGDAIDRDAITEFVYAQTKGAAA